MAEEAQKLNEYDRLKAYCGMLESELRNAKEEITRLQGLLLKLTNGWVDKETGLQQDITSASKEDADDQLSEEVDMEYCPISPAEYSESNG